MFVSALRQVERFTRPVIISTRHYSGEVKAGCGAYIILNPEGWILTAAHIIKPLLLKENHKQEISKYENEKERIKNNLGLSQHGKQRELGKLSINPEWITHVSHWWGKDGLIANEYHGDELRDIAAVRLEHFNPSDIKVFPTFWNPENILPTGKSLCRLGYPFPSVQSSFDPITNNFSITPETLQIPLFPLDGIHTRVAIVEGQDPSKNVEFIEVSTPGLRGQSGGPVFDVEGIVCGIQSRTAHLPLGFNPTIGKVVEHQFLNVGLATHAKEVLAFLHKKGIKVNVAPRTE